MRNAFLVIDDSVTERLYSKRDFGLNRFTYSITILQLIDINQTNTIEPILYIR